ncbi:hypothetical protein HN832_01805 [archaeon]|jgi:hypothetical protein|nr:hypothetical protein [archaeon]MBT4373089.1 hypothetical protein [archaeon]MBT4531434.1 hypothetical protein [archaeon]MBT7001388.1 hypothetical protein [archaeon]MBT7282126.1 hypothetical protein [archaeon]
MIDRKERELYKKYFADALKKWHNNKIDYVFLTDTATIHSGYALKEAWKQIYPNEAPPKFYRIDPEGINEVAGNSFSLMRKEPNKKRRAEKDEDLRNVENFFRRRIKKDNAKIVVFDELMIMRIAGDRALQPFPQTSSKWKGDNLWWNYDGGSQARTANFLYDAYESGLIDKKIGSIFVAGESGDLIRNPNERPTSKLGSSRGRELSEDEKYRLSSEFIAKRNTKGYPYLPLRSEIVKDPEQRKRARKSVGEAKKFGMEVGQEIYEEQEQSRDSLEKKLLGLTTIAGVGVGLFALSGNITGNVTSNLFMNLNRAGGLLLFLGLVAGYFWIRKKLKS